jgi:hypothetical protein
MRLENSEYDLLHKKLENRFKKSGNLLVEKLINKEDLTDDDLRLLSKKLEYNFKKSGNVILDRIKV